MLPLLVALWSGASPVLVQDLSPGAAVDFETYREVDTGDDPNLLVIWNEFWGTEPFTILDGRRQLIADICPGRCDSNPTAFTRLGTRFFFLASDVGAVTPDQLWISDGTNAGTQKLVSDASHLVLLQSQLVFQRPDGLWISDGTPAGTKPLTWGVGKKLASAEATPLHRFLTVNPTDCEVFVSGEDVTTATQLQKPAGFSDCVEPLVTIGERAFVPLSNGVYRFEATGSPVLVDAAVTHLTRVGTGLFFFREVTGTLFLFHSGEDPGTTTALGSIQAEDVKNVGAAAGRLVYSAIVGGVAHLYSSDGTPAGTFELPITAITTHAILPVGPVLYVVTQSATSTALIETDGTASGTVVLQGVHPQHDNGQPGHREAKGHAVALVLIANVVNEYGAFRIRPGEDPESLFLKPGNPITSTAEEPLVAGGFAWFNANGKTYQTDGTPDGSFVVSDLRLVGMAGGRPLVASDKTLSVVNADGGTTELVTNASALERFGRFGDLAIFSTDDGLFQTDGVTTTKLASPPRLGPPVVLGNGRAVVAGPGALWFTDGTAAGTASIGVAGFSSGLIAADTGAWATTGIDTVAFVTASNVVTAKLPSPNPTLLTTLGDDLLVATADSALFRVSGSTVTTLSLKLKVRSTALFNNKLMVLADGKLFELVGNLLVLKASTPGSTFLKAEGGFLFIDAASLALGLEPAAYVEPPNAPVLLGDLSFGPGSSSPSPPVALGKKFLFFAWTPETGREPFIWEPDPALVAGPRGCGCSSSGGLGLFALALLVTRRRRC